MSDNRATRGFFITFEGGEGAGKSTHARFLAEKLEERGYEVLRVREPGGTDVGEQLRSIVLDPSNETLDSKAELLIYEAARAQIVAEVIRPALERGAVVLCDRFTDSTIAYQAFGRGLPRHFVEKANEFASGGLVPDRTILVTCGRGCAKTGLRRATALSGADRLEQAGEDFHARVNEAFLQLAQEDPQRIRVIESDSSRSITSAMIFAELSDLFPWMGNATICDEEFFSILDCSSWYQQTEKR